MHDRPSGFSICRIPTIAIIKLVEAFDDKAPSRIMFNKILLIEKVAFPFIVKAAEDKEGK